MYKIVGFLIRFKNTLLFLFLLIIALSLTVQTHSYQKSKVISSANFVTGSLYSWANGISSYFRLKTANARLLQENKRLRQKIFNLAAAVIDTTYKDSTEYHAIYTVYPARVIANNYSNLDNYILIDRGKKNGVTKELGVITSKGIVGVVEEASNNYARVISILNTQLAINAQLKNSDHFGTLKWDGKDPNVMQLTYIPQIAKVKKGDTIITNGRSLIFPKGIPVGTVKSFKLDREKNYYIISVKLFNDMTDIGGVYVIKNNHRPEFDSLRKTRDEE